MIPYQTMKKPIFKYANLLYIISAVLTIPLLIDICTACHLFSLWIAWALLALIAIVCIIRLVFAFRQKCYKFAWGLIGQLVLGGAILTFFQLSYTNIIETPVSHPITPALVNVAVPGALNDTLHHHHDSIHHDSIKHHQLPATKKIRDKK